MKNTILTSKIVKKELLERLSVIETLDKINITVNEDDWGGYDIKIYQALGGTKQDDRTFKAWSKDVYFSADHSYLMKGKDSFDALTNYIIKIMKGGIK